jgi:hypothetical protein
MRKEYLEDAIKLYHELKNTGDKAIAQVSETDFFATLDDQSNSIALIVKHLAGNMRSRWTDFLTTDGEKPDRNRDYEFIITDTDTKAAIMQSWEDGWALVFGAIEPLTPDDLDKTVMIRHEPHLVLKAINRQLSHYSLHIGQIVFLAKHLAHDHWQTLSIPRNKSAEFNAKMRDKSRG